MRNKKQKIEKITHHCNRCNNPFRSKNLSPKYCNLCKSSLWNAPRVYDVDGGELPTGKRYKATGRKAANQRPEKIRLDKIADLESLERSTAREIDSLMKLINDPDFHKCAISSIAYQLFCFVRENHKIKMELATLTETDPMETYYLQKGILSGYAFRWSEFPQKLSELDSRLFRAGHLDERFADGNERARQMHEFLLEAKRLVEEIETERGALEMPTRTKTLERLKFLADAPTADEIHARKYTDPAGVFSSDKLPKDAKKQKAKLEKILSDYEKQLENDIARFNKLVGESAAEIEKRLDFNSIEGNVMLKCNHISYAKYKINAALEMLGMPKRYETETGDGVLVHCPSLTWQNRLAKPTRPS